jgi:HSP20 family protein
MAVGFDPFEALLEMQRALEESRHSDWFGPSTSSRGAFPPVNVFRRGDDLVVVAEIAGVPKEDLEISVHRNQLRLAGKKKIDYGEKISIHRQERLAQPFDRTFNLPMHVNPEGVKAEYQDGILAVYLPRAEEDKPKSIRIN